MGSSSEAGEGEGVRCRRSFSAGPPSDFDDVTAAAGGGRKSSLSAEILDYDAKEEKEVMIR